MIKIYIVWLLLTQRFKVWVDVFSRMFSLLSVLHLYGFILTPHFYFSCLDSKASFKGTLRFIKWLFISYRGIKSAILNCVVVILKLDDSILSIDIRSSFKEYVIVYCSQISIRLFINSFDWSLLKILMRSFLNREMLAKNWKLSHLFFFEIKFRLRPSLCCHEIWFLLMMNNFKHYLLISSF